MDSFAITSDTGHTFFVEADAVHVDRHGRLLFRRWYGYIVGGVDAGKWARFVRGVTLEVLKQVTNRGAKEP